MMGATLTLFILSGLILSAANVDDHTLVSLPDGQIKGKELRSPNDKVFYAFQEIPYAAPPVGSLRFKSPVAPKPWKEILNTSENTRICYQSGISYIIPGLTESEDCLYLNVYTPVKPGDSSVTPLAVLVWIHGGSFLNGAGTIQMYKPDFFMEYDIVIVTINYRVGPLGFLTTEDGIIPGNIGLKDQHLAIKWVKKNIALFGGDPEKITISGESAGAISVGLHLLSPANKGLFRNAILQSCTAIVDRVPQRHARFYAFEFGRSLNSTFTSNDSSNLLALLQGVSATEINNVKITPAPGKETGIVSGEGLIWVPVIEDSILEDAFLTGAFHEDIRTGNIIQVPILIGFNSLEQLLFMYLAGPRRPETLAKYFDSDLKNLIRDKFNMTEKNKLIAGTRLRAIYTDGTFEDDLSAVVKISTYPRLGYTRVVILTITPISTASVHVGVKGISRQTYQEDVLELFFSDETYTTPIIRHAKLQSKFTDVFLYQFSYKGKMGGLQDIEIAGVQGVGHTEDLGYLWDARLTVVDPPYDSEDLLTRRRLLTMWTNFVKYLNPTPEDDSLLENVRWPSVAPNNLVYLNINHTLEMLTNPKEYLKWERIIDIYAIPPFINY